MKKWSQEFYDKRFEVRFWRCVKKTDSCWIWTGPKNWSGYGIISRRGQGQKRAHRISWEFKFGKPPDNLCLCHTCDNPPCVNPSHLWLGTKRENMLDAYKKGRMKRGEESGTSKLKNSDIFRIRKLRKNGFSEKEIAEEIGTTRSNIGNILQGNTWKHI